MQLTAGADNDETVRRVEKRKRAARRRGAAGISISKRRKKKKSKKKNSFQTKYHMRSFLAICNLHRRPAAFTTCPEEPEPTSRGVCKKKKS